MQSCKFLIKKAQSIHEIPRDVPFLTVPSKHVVIPLPTRIYAAWVFVICIYYWHFFL